MSNQIRVTPELLQQRAAEYRNERDKVADVLAKMDNLLKSLEAEWEGNSARDFQAQFAEVRPSFVTAQDIIKGIAKGLEKKAAEFSRVDGQ